MDGPRCIVEYAAGAILHKRPGVSDLVHPKCELLVQIARRDLMQKLL